MIYIDNNGKLNLSRLYENQKAFIKSNYLHTGIVGGYQCIPGYTEYLTMNGWKRIDSFDNEKILIFNPEDNSTFFERPLRYINQTGGEFIKFKTDIFQWKLPPIIK